MHGLHSLHHKWQRAQSKPLVMGISVCQVDSLLSSTRSEPSMSQTAHHRCKKSGVEGQTTTPTATVLQSKPIASRPTHRTLIQISDLMEENGLKERSLTPTSTNTSNAAPQHAASDLATPPAEFRRWGNGRFGSEEKF